MVFIFALLGLLTGTGGKHRVHGKIALKSCHHRKGVGKAMLGRVVKEAMDRDIHNVFTFVRADNKAGLHLNRKFGLLPKGPSNQNPSLVTVEKILHQDF